MEDAGRGGWAPCNRWKDSLAKPFGFTRHPMFEYFPIEVAQDSPVRPLLQATVGTHLVPAASKVGAARLGRTHVLFLVIRSLEMGSAKSRGRTQGPA